jgi:hypothetical protein
MGRIVGVRGDTVIREPDVVGDHSGNSEDHAQEILKNELINLAAKTFDASRPVNEYQSVSSATSLEVLPEYEMDELIEAIVVVANPYQTTIATSGTTTGTTGTNPAALSIITSQALAAGTYTVAWTAQLGGTPSAADANNFGLYLGTTQVAASLNGIVATTPYPQPTVTIVVPVGGGTVSVKNIAQPGGTPTYTAQLTITQQLIANVVTLQLGRRLWNLSMAPNGIIELDGLALRLNRNERRIATQGPAGPLSLELTGHADMSGT